jgi:type IV secretion system protein TrbC
MPYCNDVPHGACGRMPDRLSDRGKTISCGRVMCVLTAIILLLTVAPMVAHASSTTGSLPWDTPLTTLRNDITGSVAFTISLLAMVACGAALVFGGEIHEFVRRIIMLVLVASFIVGVSNLASALGITGALI